MIAPSHGVRRRPLARFLHRVYKVTLSPLIGQQCRFRPTCSDFAVEAVERHGWWRGGFLALRRVVRCQPWCTGGDDPVP
jgi:putative membrane protein insertion efficiency factor